MCQRREKLEFPKGMNYNEKKSLSFTCWQTSNSVTPVQKTNGPSFLHSEFASSREITTVRVEWDGKRWDESVCRNYQVAVSLNVSPPGINTSSRHAAGVSWSGTVVAAAASRLVVSCLQSGSGSYSHRVSRLWPDTLISVYSTVLSHLQRRLKVQHSTVVKT